MAAELQEAARGELALAAAETATQVPALQLSVGQQAAVWGEVRVVWRGVYAAAAAAMKSSLGMDIARALRAARCTRRVGTGAASTAAAARRWILGSSSVMSPTADLLFYRRW
jgi:hypothetical protein